MKIEIMDQITIEDDRNFIVSNITKYNDKEYYLLVNVDDESDVMIAYLDGEELISVEDVMEYIEILKKFDTNKILSDFTLNEIIELNS